MCKDMESFNRTIGGVTMSAVLNLQKLAVSADGGERIEDAFLDSGSSYACSGWMNSNESHYCTVIDNQIDLG